MTIKIDSSSSPSSKGENFNSHELLTYGRKFNQITSTIKTTSYVVGNGLSSFMATAYNVAKYAYNKINELAVGEDSDSDDSNSPKTPLNHFDINRYRSDSYLSKGSLHVPKPPSGKNKSFDYANAPKSGSAFTDAGLYGPDLSEDARAILIAKNFNDILFCDKVKHDQLMPIQNVKYTLTFDQFISLLINKEGVSLRKDLADIRFDFEGPFVVPDKIHTINQPDSFTYQVSWFSVLIF